MSVGTTAPNMRITIERDGDMIGYVETNRDNPRTCTTAISQSLYELDDWNTAVLDAQLCNLLSSWTQELYKKRAQHRKEHQ